jgi:hypothetical protein
VARSSGNEQVKQELTQNSAVFRQAEEEVKKFQQAPAERDGTDNRVRFNALYDEQRTSRAKNVVKELGRNFDAPAPADAKGDRGITAGVKLNEAWLANSQLAAPAGGESKEEGKQDKSGGALRLKKGADIAVDESVVNPGISAKQPAAAPAQQAQAEGQQARREGRQRDAVERYQQRLERGGQQASQGQPVGDLVQSPSSMTANGRAFGVTALGGAAPADADAFRASERRVRASQLFAEGKGPTLTFTPGEDRQGALITRDGAVQQAVLPTGLASLDFEVPKRGTLYRFTTPGGDVEITAHAASGKLLERLARAAAVLVAAGLVLLIARHAKRGGLSWLAGPIGCAAMVVLGVVLLLAGFVLAGLVLTILGIVLAVRRTLRKRSAARAAATA